MGCNQTPMDKEGRRRATFEEICVNGVVYYRRADVTYYSIAPKFSVDSKVVTCN